MLKNNIFREISDEQFLEIASNAVEGDWQQTLEMRNYLHSSNWDTYLMGLVDENNNPIMASLIFGKKIFAGYRMELTHGPLYKEFSMDNYVEYLEGLKKFAKEKNALEFYIRPNVTFQMFNDQGETTSESNDMFLEMMEKEGFKKIPSDDMNNYEWRYVKNLNDFDQKTLFKSFTKDGQYSIKKTKQFGVRVRSLSYEELPNFKKVTEHTAERRGYDDKSLEYYQDIYNIFGDKAEFLVAEINLKDYKDNLIANQNDLKTKLADIEEFLVKTPNSRKKNNQKKEVVSEISTYDKRISEADELIEEHGKNDILLSVALFIYSSTETVYLFSGTYDKYKRFYAPFAIQEYALNKTLANNVPVYNFYGISGKFDGSDGVLGFKTNFSGYITQKVGEFVYYPKPAKKKVIDFAKSITGRN
ncbi:hypothetical protein BG261_02080 [Floricoccus tropicus]|uniref:Aminoacyltransferase FemA n=1 Tax=Floricoccus tropicus TaxID=1859473 RepID=A0A1E8GP53_9LACT|nr:peptidoglycan bridge formation glycyltransferase FemA/FemB family protein [Floricoccus tropicus]OFI49393.1 hypothetical protein BG261_02080 [Floricoccus tropicus]